MTVWILKKLRRFVWKKLLESKALLSSNFFHTNLLIFFEIQTIIKSHSLMLGTSNFAILVFSICSFHFWHSLSYIPWYKIFLGKLRSRDPSCKGPITITYIYITFKYLKNKQTTPVVFLHATFPNVLMLVFYQAKLINKTFWQLILGNTYPASSWFLLRQTREKPLRATVRSFEVTAIQCHGQIN